MAKFLKDSEFNALQDKANGFDQIVAAIVALNPKITAEEITTDQIIQYVTPDPQAADLQTKYKELQASYTTLEAQNKELEKQNAALRDSAGEDSGEITSHGEASGKTETLAQFADKNKGNVAAILAKCAKEGLFN